MTLFNIFFFDKLMITNPSSLELLDLEHVVGLVDLEFASKKCGTAIFLWNEQPNFPTMAAVFFLLRERERVPVEGHLPRRTLAHLSPPMPAQ